MWLPESSLKPTRRPKNRPSRMVPRFRLIIKSSINQRESSFSPLPKSTNHVNLLPELPYAVEMSDDELNEDPTADLLKTYAELNSSTIEALDECPSALEFLRYVKKNRPFVVRKGAQDWKATRTWNRAYLEAALRNQSVNVSVSYGCVLCSSKKWVLAYSLPRL